MWWRQGTGPRTLRGKLPAGSVLRLHEGDATVKNCSPHTLDLFVETGIILTDCLDEAVQPGIVELRSDIEPLRLVDLGDPIKVDFPSGNPP
jgi:hypothetical protein